MPVLCIPHGRLFLPCLPFFSLSLFLGAAFGPGFPLLVRLLQLLSPWFGQGTEGVLLIDEVVSLVHDLLEGAGIHLASSAMNTNWGHTPPRNTAKVVFSVLVFSSHSLLIKAG